MCGHLGAIGGQVGPVDVVVAVRPVLFVIQTNGVPNLVDDCGLRPALSTVVKEVEVKDGHSWPDALPTHPHVANVRIAPRAGAADERRLVAPP